MSNDDKKWPVTSGTPDPTKAPDRFLMSPPLPSPRDSPPPEPEVEVTFGARSSRGPRRFKNEDHYMVLRLGRYQDTLLTSLSADDVAPRFDEHGYGMIVADGLGGSGETASRLAVSTLVHLALSFGRWHIRIDVPVAEEVMERADRFYRAVDATLLQAGQDSSRALQTTLTAVFTAGTDLFFAHVGHSRAYLFRQDQLFQLTRDHTREPEPGRTRTLAAVGGGTRDVRQVVTETLGREGPGIPRVDVERCGMLDGDVILLCTNGLTDVVDDERIAMVLTLHPTPDDQCRALVELAASSGGQDDVTVVTARYRIPPEIE
jgi:protein phosphatase